jgi:hypothetical protein
MVFLGAHANSIRMGIMCRDKKLIWYHPSPKQLLLDAEPSQQADSAV